MPKTKPRGAERRRFTRFKSYNILQVIRRNDEPVTDAPKLVNISEGGLCFYSTDELRIGERIRIRIGISEFRSSVTTGARVVWNQISTEHTGAHFMGAEFVGLKESDRDILRRLERASRKKR